MRGPEAPEFGRRYPDVVLDVTTEDDSRRDLVTLAVRGPLIVDDVDLTLRAALDGIGLAFTVEEHCAPHPRRAGSGSRGLGAPFEGWFLYYPTRRQQPPALQALIDMLRYRG